MILVGKDNLRSENIGGLNENEHDIPHGTILDKDPTAFNERRIRTPSNGCGHSIIVCAGKLHSLTGRRDIRQDKEWRFANNTRMCSSPIKGEVRHR